MMMMMMMMRRGGGGGDDDGDDVERSTLEDLSRAKQVHTGGFMAAIMVHIRDQQFNKLQFIFILDENSNKL